MDYKEQIEAQKATLKKLTDEHSQKPTDESARRIVRESDVLRHLVNAVNGDPKKRAHAAAQTAKSFVLGKAIA